MSVLRIKRVPCSGCDEGFHMGVCPNTKIEANIRALEAAAPDLYFALDNAQKMINFMRQQCLLHNDTKHATEHAHDVWFEALNALRKARGE